MVFRNIRSQSLPRPNFPARYCLYFSLLALSKLSAAAETVTLNVESDALDLDNGAISQTGPGEPTATSGADVQVAYNADRTPHAVVIPGSGDVELAFVAGVGFDGISSSDIPSLNFSSEAPDLPFTVNDCVVIRTDQGTYFKLGNAIEAGLSITFNYEAL